MKCNYVQQQGGFSGVVLTERRKSKKNKYHMISWMQSRRGQLIDGNGRQDIILLPPEVAGSE